MEENLAQVNDLPFVPHFEPVEISREDVSMVLAENSHETSKLRVSTLGLEESLPKATDLLNWQVLPNMNIEIHRSTNVVSVYEDNEDMVAEKPINFSYVSPPPFINELELVAIMIADGPPKSVSLPLAPLGEH
ncbi:hypothetical protein HPB52_021406 [Rhipicephalus sanguineus]|uniref:Uncharacterized protein n=1 Tax=Rhipicephalus sanguineus TaxID=34632 RepID=A0A9D4PE16_RHISA|nr:hypothetical protein HPB52_021406 [Rhipicephalus sanguineus]